MTRRSFLKTSSAGIGAVAPRAKLSTATDRRLKAGPTFRRPKTVLPVPTPSSKYQRVEDGVPDTQLTRELPDFSESSARLCSSVRSL